MPSQLHTFLAITGIAGDSIVMPSIVKIDECTDKPSSKDIKYIEIWQEAWKDVKFEKIVDEWKK